MTRKFDEVLVIQASFGTQLQSLNEKVNNNYHQTREYLDSLREQLSNVEDQVISRPSPSSPDPPNPLDFSCFALTIYVLLFWNIFGCINK